jgi:hypothetical protein
MNQLTKIEILKVLAWYHNCNVQIFDAMPPTPARIEGVQYYNMNEKILAEHTAWEPELVKPVLKPVHHLTNSDILMACRAYDKLPFHYSKHSEITIAPVKDSTNKRIIMQHCPYTYLFDTHTGAISLYKDSHMVWSQESLLLLTQHYFQQAVAIPLYFGFGHWANGKTAIELGIAIPNRDKLFKALNKKFNNDRAAADLWLHEQETYHNVNFFDLAVLDSKIAELSLQSGVA